MHPAAPGLMSARPKIVERVPSATLSPTTISRPQGSPQTILQAGSSTNVNTNARETGLVAPASSVAPATTVVVASVPAESTERLLAKQKIEETKNTMEAVRIVINHLNVDIPAEAGLLRPLFNMERRLQEEIFAGERQAATLP
ncbi:hypothetical protein BGX26_003262 [Mortierella sp. AD094]|nr:hypothetical protein BGX26_003262 [Mortierella sp. AD094]